MSPQDLSNHDDTYKNKITDAQLLPSLYKKSMNKNLLLIDTINYKLPANQISSKYPADTLNPGKKMTALPSVWMLGGI